MSSAIYLAIPLMALLAILQAAVLPHFPILGVAPQLGLLAAVTWGLLRNLEEGVIWAFLAGLFADLFSAGPVGASSLSLMVAVVVVVLIQRNFPQSRFLLPLLLGGVATLVFWLVYLLSLTLIMPLLIRDLPFLSTATLDASARAPGLLADIRSGYGINAATIEFVILAVAVHALLTLPVYWSFHTLDRVLHPRRVEI
ncbi:MAG: rod shape-determining protein MreD [Chloroflexi bacterium]|nr:rod shape-determining protein MreD [Chloroflexota bacterium]MCI0578441.1 rod shape-determining protein MreD [Chloroflexota bacterium]MCI0643887.1 rod shape-determining protein MreD [Chloroflexota bacterium]MCI0729203.1 rod shape-determining protein MreD [Chloroflexota bacterium]